MQLVGCDKKAPGCSDEETKKLVLQIAREKLDEEHPIVYQNYYGVTPAEAVLSLEDIRVQEIDKDTGACSCAANLVTSAPGKGAIGKKAIGYKSELTDKDGGFYVTVYNMR